VREILKGPSLVTIHASDIHKKRTDVYIEVLRRGWEVDEIFFINRGVL
jgi:hypothetical protein